MRIVAEASYNFNRRALRGANFEVLPFISVFPPPSWGGYPTKRGWTIHFGWLWWTVIMHQYD